MSIITENKLLGMGSPKLKKAEPKKVEDGSVAKKNSSTSSSSEGVRVSLSNEGGQVASLSKQSEATRAADVASLKDAIEKNQYYHSAEEIADAMVQKIGLV